MKKGDFVFVLVLLLPILFIASPATSGLFLAMTAASPQGMAFLKFFIMATMGDMLGGRIVSGKWAFMTGQIYRSIIWGFLGISIGLAFNMFSIGVNDCIAKGLLPGNGVPLAIAFQTSLTFNLFFAPTLMGFHRCTDTFIDLKYANTGEKITAKKAIETVNWVAFVNFTLLKTIPFFWIPVQTITFSLPPEYRVVMAAFLSIALGGILSFAKRKAQ